MSAPQRITKAALTILALVVLMIAIFSQTALAEDGFIDEAKVQSDYEVKVPKNQLALGSLEYQYPIAIPPGRAGLQPGIALSYNSSASNGWLGMSWQLDMGAIERSTKFGLDYDANDYVSVKNGQKSELVLRPEWGSRHFGARIEQAFTRYYHTTSGGWEVEHKDGTIYYYGTTSASRQTNSHGTFKWCLDRVTDANGNEMTLAYTKNQGQIYLSSIDYPGNNTVHFIRDNGQRPDQVTRYDTQAPVTTAYRLQTIEVEGNGLLSSRYELQYGEDPLTSLSRLAKITHYGSDGYTTLPATSFSYFGSNDGSFTDSATQIDVSRICYPPSNPYEEATFNAIAGDFNGDGRSDLFTLDITSDTPKLWTLNENGVFTDRSPFTADLGARWGAGDFNGDGRTDLFSVRVLTNTPLDGLITYSQNMRVFISNADGSFSQKGVNVGNGLIPGLWITSDFNGDGKTEIAQLYGIHQNYFDPHGVNSEEFAWYGIRLWTLQDDGYFHNIETLGPEEYCVEKKQTNLNVYFPSVGP